MAVAQTGVIYNQPNSSNNLKTKLVKFLCGLVLLEAAASSPAQSLLSTLGNPNNYQINPLDKLNPLGYEQVDQSFTTGGSAASIGSVDLFIYNVNPANTAFSVSIFSDSGGSVGSLISGGLLINPGSYTDNATNTFTATGLTLSANTTYWLVLDNPGLMPDWVVQEISLAGTTQPVASSSAGWTLNNAIWVSNNGDPYAIGQSVIPLFAINLAVDPVPEPSTMALAALGGASLLLFRRRKKVAQAFNIGFSDWHGAFV